MGNELLLGHVLCQHAHSVQVSQWLGDLNNWFDRQPWVGDSLKFSRLKDKNIQLFIDQRFDNKELESFNLEAFPLTRIQQIKTWITVLWASLVRNV